MSLSPRPEMLTITTSDGHILGARLMHSATAWADSRAQMMPSRWASWRRASRASLVVGGDVFGAALIVQPGVLGSDGRVVESGGDGVGEGDLSGGVLQ